MSIYDDSWGEVDTPRRISLNEQEQTGLARRRNLERIFIPATVACWIARRWPAWALPAVVRPLTLKMSDPAELAHLLSQIPDGKEAEARVADGRRMAGCR